MRTIFAMLLMVFSIAAYAGPPTPTVPEPGVLELLGVGVAAALALRLKRKKR